MVLKNVLEFICVFIAMPWCILADTKEIPTGKLLARYLFTLALAVLCVWMEFHISTYPTL